jgi:hypothetical protein
MIAAETQSGARLAVALAPALADLFGHAIGAEGPDPYTLAEPAVPPVWESQAASEGRC